MRSPQELVEPVVALVHPAFHIAGYHTVTMLLALELDDRCDRGSTVMFFEEGCLKGLAWHAFEVPGLHYALGAHDLAEFAVEAVFGAIRVDVSEVPSTAGADIHLLDRHLVFSGAHPLGREFCVGVCPEDEVAGRLERPDYVDLSIARGCYDCRLRRGL